MSTLVHDSFSDRTHFQLIGRYLREHWVVFIAICCMMLLNVLLGMIAPLIINYIVDIVEQNGPLSGSDPVIYQAIAAYGLFAILGWFAVVIQFVFVSKLSARFIRDLRIDAYSNLLHNHIPFYDDQKSGDLTSRIINDTRELSESANSIAAVFTSILRLLFVVGIFLYFSPIMSIAALVFLPIVLLVAIFLGKFERRVSATWRDRFGEVNSRFHEIMSKISISKVFDREEENLQQFKQVNESTYQASVKRGFAIFIFWPFTDLMKHFLTIVILAVGTWQVGLGLPIATLVLFIVLINYYYWPLITIAYNYHRIQGAFASLNRIAKISFNDGINEIDSGTTTSSIEGRIDFDHLTFSYTDDLPVLKDISFSIKPGQRVALVGHTGAGKSTIASLLMRFYEVSPGSIKVDNMPINEYDLHHYRSSISLVSQRVLLFNGSIRENLKISSPDINDEEIWEVLDLVQAREFIEALPEGLDTIIEESAKNLSAGQKQMISFARAILADPEIIILDEATSAVDLYTEQKIQDAIDTILESRTSISIAHRLTTILKSDLIVVLEHGRMVEIGDHDELIAKDGVYADMYQLYLQTQSAQYLDIIKR